MGKRKFDTCFFERYAQICLETLLGRKYEALQNEDRPDLQMPDKSLGIEVTRAMEPRKDVARDLLKEMAGMDILPNDREEMDQIIKSGYGYGLQDGRYIGHLEYELDETLAVGEDILAVECKRCQLCCICVELQLHLLVAYDCLVE